MLKNIAIEGNPLKTIRRPIIARGSQGILAYLADKYVDGTDDKVEQWAEEQSKRDKEEQAEYEAKKLEIVRQKQIEYEERERAEQERLRQIEEE